VLEVNTLKSIPEPYFLSRPYDLKVERLLDASPSSIFKAWTKQMDQWFAEPGTVLMEGKEDTAFFFYTYFEGNRHPHYGRFLELQQDHYIKFTWVTGAGGTLGAETVVTIELTPIGNKTNVCLTHAGFPNEDSRHAHEAAWPSVLDHLNNRLKELD
jgi:uncharacterized protein YndB with AHSA1/START domain